MFRSDFRRTDGARHGSGPWGQGEPGRAPRRSGEVREPEPTGTDLGRAGDRLEPERTRTDLGRPGHLQFPEQPGAPRGRADHLRPRNHGPGVRSMTSRATPSSNEPYDVLGAAQFGTPRRLAPCAEGCFSSQAGLASFQPWPIEQAVSGAEGSDGHDVHAVPPAVSETPAGEDDAPSLWL